MDAFADAYDHVVDKNLLIRRYNLTAEVEEVKEKAADSVKDGVTHGKKPSGNKSKKKK